MGPWSTEASGASGRSSCRGSWPRVNWQLFANPDGASGRRESHFSASAMTVEENGSTVAKASASWVAAQQTHRRNREYDHDRGQIAL